MALTDEIRKILLNYSSDNIGTKTNIARILNSGRLSGTGKLLILPVDQGFEHGPDKSFSVNPEGYDPCYHHGLAVEAGLSAYASPLGMLELSSDRFIGVIPTILKMNSSNSLTSKELSPNQAVTANVSDAIRLGCSAVGYTIYPGSNNSYDMLNDLREISNEAKSYGLAVVVWSYPRGEGISDSKNETALDVINYAAHIAALSGAHIIKVKIPSANLHTEKSIEGFDLSVMSDRIRSVVRSCFNGQRIVVFSGGGKKNDNELFNEIDSIVKGGGNGSIIGRNIFQRKKEDALKLLDSLIGIMLKN